MSNFNITTYQNPNQTIVWPALKPNYYQESLVRKVAGNRLVSGVLIQAKQRKRVTCGRGELAFGKSEFAFSDLVRMCPSEFEESTESYGVDPVFLPTSSMYRADLDVNNYYNTSDPSEMSEKGYPYGFKYRNLQAEAGFFVFLDINFSQERCGAYLQYLEDGFFINSYTSEVKVMFIVYNGFHGVFAYVVTTFSFDEGGTVYMGVEVSTFKGAPYQTTTDVVRLVLEIMFGLLLIVNLVGELFELYGESVKYGSISSYFNFWNLIDWANMGCFLYLFYIWSMRYTVMMGEYQPKIRYNVYNDLFSEANYVNNINQHEMDHLLEMFHKTIVIVGDIKAYMEVNGICMLLVMLRLLKLLDFQPKLGLITKTIFKAASDLGHFMIIFVFVVGIYTVQAYYLFGNSIEDFSNPGAAFNTCFNMLMGDNGPNSAVLALRPVAGAIFIYTFILVVFFVLLNILLAILVEAYLRVVEDAQTALSVVEELGSLGKAMLKGTEFYRQRIDKKAGKRNFKHLNDKAILETLGPGSDDEEEVDEVTGRVVGSERKLHDILKVPVDQDDDGEAEWVEAHAGTIIKALTLHPQTRHLSHDQIKAVAGSIIYRYGEKEERAKVTVMNPALEEALNDRKNQLMEAGILRESQGEVKVNDAEHRAAYAAKEQSSAADVVAVASAPNTESFYHTPAFAAPDFTASAPAPAPDTPGEVTKPESATTATSLSQFQDMLPFMNPGGCSRTVPEPTAPIEKPL